ncbi:CocE/NonD family hydrolase [Halorarius litoreus]|uniref:CocE/NonD family hydrolase n=1 Tax=Halorarius litoreus TaxID=2962676 RepID=UPI0020CDEF1B|nr:CocE/NonD family hydrolase [Halorarius litoreus]
MRDHVSRRTLLRLAGATGVAAVAGPSATGAAMAVPNDDYETTEGESAPRYGQSAPEQHYVDTAYTMPDAVGGAEESPTLFGEIIWPTEDGEKRTDVPVILTYSPYNDIKSPQSEAASIAADGTADYFVPRGYARAVFDVVGCRNSGGCYDYGGYRERVTGKQLVEYLGGEPDASGATVDGTDTTRTVGMIGGSYDGTTQLAAAAEQPKHLAAIVPQVAIDRWYDYAFGGGIRYFLNNEYPTDEGFDTPLAFDFGFGFLPPANVDDTEQFAATMEQRFAPCDAVEHTERAYEYDPVYDDFWERRDYRRRADQVECAVFIEGGWLDHNVKHWDSTRFFMALPERVDKKLVMGQWNHSASQFEDAQDIRHAWFDYHLKGLDTDVMALPRVDTQTSTGERLQHDHWPPAGTRNVVLDLTRADTDDGALALQGSVPSYTDTEPPLTEEEMFATATSQHNHLKFESGPLSGELRLTGSPLLDLLATSTADSTHFTPVLYARFEDGSTQVATRGFLNARNRDGLDTSEPVPVGEPYRAPVELWDTDYTFSKGSKVGLVVASDNRDWCLNDPDGHATNEVVLGAPGGSGGTTLRLPTTTAPPELDRPEVSGTRTDDGSVFTGGQTNQIDIEVTADGPVRLRDRVPTGWRVLDAGDVDTEATTTRADGSTDVRFDVAPSKTQSVTYFVEAPNSPGASGQSTFGPVEAAAPNRDAWVVVPGTEDENTALGVGTGL